MAEVGIVKEIKGKDVIVSLVRHEACKHCQACTQGMQEKEMILEASNECGALVGDHVEVTLEVSPFLQASFIMYGIPLLALLIGIVGGYTVAGWYGAVESKELWALGSGFGLVIITYGIIALNEKTFKQKKFKPKAIRRVES